MSVGDFQDRATETERQVILRLTKVLPSFLG